MARPKQRIIRVGESNALILMRSGFNMRQATSVAIELVRDGNQSNPKSFTTGVLVGNEAITVDRQTYERYKYLYYRTKADDFVDGEEGAWFPQILYEDDSTEPPTIHIGDPDLVPITVKARNEP